MKRAEKVRKKAEEIIENGERPSATRISQELEFGAPDVHRCLNYLEKNKEVETYRRKVLGKDYRMVGVKRN